ncbi:MAG: 2-hydroxyacid dehydrogenase [Candidatus Eremiobacteraeota bacterium]|nr:2-hydroxyacid dehydrogenase [Candidatus Eremiobacteraeota bacterium]
MKILFCERGYPHSRQQLSPLIPGWAISTCGRDEIAAHIKGVDVIVPYLAKIDRTIIDAGSFGLIQQFGVGLETVDVDAATASGVWVARVPSAGSGNAESVAEHAVFLMLALARRFPQAVDALRAGLVGDPAGLALKGKTACIVGLGHAGSALARLLTAFRMRVVGVRAHPEQGLPEGLPDLRLYAASDLKAAVAHADHVVICVKLGAETRNLIDASVLQAMKPGAFLINVARGGLVDPHALLQALRSGQLAGAGLDVFWDEPVDLGHPLFRENIIATPHIAGVTDDSYAGIAHAVAQNLYRFAQGEAPHHTVNAPPIIRWRPGVQAH